jgi:hypothetical protein
MCGWSCRDWGMWRLRSRDLPTCAVQIFRRPCESRTVATDACFRQRQLAPTLRRQAAASDRARCAHLSAARKRQSRAAAMFFPTSVLPIRKESFSRPSSFARFVELSNAENLPRPRRLPCSASSSRTFLRLSPVASANSQSIVWFGAWTEWTTRWTSLCATSRAGALRGRLR